MAEALPLSLREGKKYGILSLMKGKKVESLSLLKGKNERAF